MPMVESYYLKILVVFLGLSAFLQPVLVLAAACLTRTKIVQNKSFPVTLPFLPLDGFVTNHDGTS